jgi:ornithine cyclodeaminase/alanine dehydrogenase-like protein (mu-crystallin family)
MLVLTRNEVEELLDLDALPDALAAAHAELSGGQASLVPRMGAFAGEAGILGAMPAYAASSGLGCKLVTLFPGNRDRPTHQALIALFDPETGTPEALMDGTYITAMRTAAAAALATRLLARPDARVLAILGTGVQSRSAQEMFPRVRDFTEVRVAGRGEFEEAVRGADVVHATTASAEARRSLRVAEPRHARQLGRLWGGRLRARPCDRRPRGRRRR